MSRIRTLLGSILGVPSLAVFSLLAGAELVRAEVYVTPKHLLILRGAVDTLYGSYIFALQNSGDTAETFKTPLTLPLEKDDWATQEGLEPSEVSLGSSGNLIIEKSVQPGVNLLGIDFKVPASFGHTTLTFKPEATIESMIVLVPRGSSVSIESGRFAPADSSQAPDPQYVPWHSSGPLAAGETVTIDVYGLPEGRARLWIVGSAVAGLLLVLAGFVGWRTRPKITSDGAQSVLVG